MARVPVRRNDPSATTTPSDSTTSFIVPYRTALVPEARVAAMPPREASAPGSMGKKSPLSRRCSLSCLRVTPGSTAQSRSSALTARTLFMRERSSETPPCGALTWPSSEEPTPNGTIGASCRAQSLTRSITSSLSSANTTPSGGSFLSQVSVCPCAWRIASEAVKRLPKRAARSELSAVTASVESRPWRWRTERWVTGVLRSLLGRPKTRRAEAAWLEARAPWVLTMVMTMTTGGGRDAADARSFELLSNARIGRRLSEGEDA